MKKVESSNNLKSSSNKSFIGKQMAQAFRKTFHSIGTAQPNPNNLYYLLQTPRSTDAELMTILVSKYNGLVKELQDSKKVSQEQSGIIDLWNKKLSMLERKLTSAWMQIVCNRCGVATTTTQTSQHVPQKQKFSVSEQNTADVKFSSSVEGPAPV